MSTEADMEALAEAVVFAHEAGTAPPPADDRQAMALERTAAMALVGLARCAEVPTGLSARLAADGLQFCATRSTARPIASGRRMRPVATALAFACGLAAGAILWLLLGSANRTEAPSMAQRLAALAAEAGVVRLPWKAGPSPRSGDVHGEVVWSPERQEGYLTFVGLPPVDAEHRFQLWIVDGSRAGAPVDGGLFAIADPATATIVPVQARLPVGKAAAFVVTIEPKAGVVVSKQEHVVALAGL